MRNIPGEAVVLLVLALVAAVVIWAVSGVLSPVF